MSAGTKKDSSKGAPHIRVGRHLARVKLVGRALGLLQIAGDLLEGAEQLGDQPCAELGEAQENVRRAKDALAPKAAG